MEMQIILVAGFKYRSNMTQCPVKIMITSVQPVEIADKIHISSGGLTRPGGFFLGFSHMSTAVIQGSKVLDHYHPYNLSIDLLEDGPPPAPIEPGRYEIQVEALYFRKTPTGYTAQTLRGKLPLDVTP